MKKNDVLDQIQKKADEYQLVPSKDLWDKLEAQLAQDNASKSKKSTYRWAVIAASIALIITGTTLWMQQKNQTTNPVAVTELSENDPSAANELSITVENDADTFDNTQTITIQEEQVASTTDKSASRMADEKAKTTVDTRMQSEELLFNEKPNAPTVLLGKDEEEITNADDKIEVKENNKSIADNALKNETMASPEFKNRSRSVEKNESNPDGYFATDKLSKTKQSSRTLEKTSIEGKWTSVNKKGTPSTLIITKNDNSWIFSFPNSSVRDIILENVKSSSQSLWYTSQKGNFELELIEKQLTITQSLEQSLPKKMNFIPSTF